MLHGARLKAREAFEQAQGLVEGSEETSKSIQHAEDVARILRENVVQGEADARNDQYSMWRFMLEARVYLLIKARASDT